jgi:hypothetical protein
VFKEIDKKIKEFVFSDYCIESMSVDKDAKCILVKIDGALLVINDTYHEYEEVQIKIFNWDKICISLYENEEKKWVEIQNTDIDTLEEINEIEENGNLILRGFGAKTGKWLEYVIEKPMVKIFANQNRDLDK